MANFAVAATWFALLLVLFFSFLSIYTRRPKKASTTAAKHPPSPPRLPIIGNLHQLGRLTHRSLWQLSKIYGPVMLLQLGNIPTLVISSAEMAKDVLKIHDLDFSGRSPTPGARRFSYNLMDVAFTPFTDHWREMRKIFVSELFNQKKRAQSLRNARETEVNRLIEYLSTASPNPVNLGEKIFDLLDGIICVVAFGKSCREERFGGQNLKAFIDEAMDSLGAFSVEDFFPSIGWIADTIMGQQARLESCFRKLNGYFDMMIDEHLDVNWPKPEHEDIVDVLVALSKNESGAFPLTKNHMKAVLMNIFIGAIDTSGVTIVWAMAELIKNPRVMQKLQCQTRGCIGKKPKVDEDDLPKLTYLKMVVKETLRLHPPLPILVPRESIRQCKIGYGDGYDIYPNTRLLVNVWAIGRDPESWKNPCEFYPERFEENDLDFGGQHFELLPFGAGRRSCPGFSVGITTIELALANLLYCFDWEMPRGMKREDFSMDEDGAFAVQKKTPLCLLPIKHEWGG